MKILYYDCFAGISGDMNRAALIDAGLDLQALESELGKLGLDGWSLKASKASRGGIFGTRLDVLVSDEKNCCRRTGHFGHSEYSSHSEHSGHAHRKFSDIAEMLEKSNLSDGAKKRALSIFSLLAEAEAKVHGKEVSEVSFHEVGAVDSIIDIVGCAVALELLGIDEVVSSPVELGGGTVECAHGRLPVPAPATAILAKSFPSKIGGANHECTTPTGAAIIASLCSGFSGKIEGRVVAEGVGVGHRESPELPNVLRVMVFDTEASCTEKAGEAVESMAELSANIDDMTPEHVSELCAKLMAAGALDAWCEPVVMKKGRCAVKVCALARFAEKNKVLRAFFANSSTLGIRESTVFRHALGRELVDKDTEFGKVRFKRHCVAGIERVKPEFEDTKKISESTGMPVDIVSEKLKHGFEK